MFAWSDFQELLLDANMALLGGRLFSCASAVCSLLEVRWVSQFFVCGYFVYDSYRVSLPLRIQKTRKPAARALVLRLCRANSCVVA